MRIYCYHFSGLDNRCPNRESEIAFRINCSGQASDVIPAKAGIQAVSAQFLDAYAGMTILVALRGLLTSCE
jgi:hypothetical protein